jgi:hypothetical protein
MPDAAPGARDPRPDLFDLAVNRALAYARRTPAAAHARDVETLARALEPWALRTRFASRFDPRDVAACLLSAPDGEVHWSGGRRGGWRPGRPPRP